MTWDPLHRIDNDPRFIRNPEQAKAFAEYGIAKDDEVWINDRYQVRVRYLESVVPTDDEVSVPVGRDGLIHLSINAHDRSPVRNWRHLQAIKNEVAGPKRWAIEIFPSEDELVDTSNQFHLWVMPTSMPSPPFIFRQRLVSTDEDVERFNAEPHKGRQEPFEDGLTTGPRPDDRSMYEIADEQRNRQQQ